MFKALVNYQVADRGESASWSTSPALIEPHVTGFLGDVDVVVAGPPCQGYLNLINSTA